MFTIDGLRSGRRNTLLGAAGVALGAALLFPGIAAADDGSDAAAAAAAAASQQSTQDAIYASQQATQAAQQATQGASQMGPQWGNTGPVASPVPADPDGPDASDPGSP